MNRLTTEVWEEFSQDIHGFISRRVQDPDDAADILQDVFVKIHTHIDTLEDHERLAPWLYQIARNTITDYYRTRRSHDPLPEILPHHKEEDGNPEDDAERQLAMGLQGIIACLPEKYQEALLLTEIQGLKQQDLAERLGISLSGAKSRVQRGRQLLKQSLLECCHFEFDRRGRVMEYIPRQECCQECCE